MDWLFTESWVEATRVVASHVTAAKESRGLDWMVGAGFGKSRYGSRGEDWSGEEWIGKARIGLARLVTAAMLCSGMERRGLVRRAWQAKVRTGSDRQPWNGSLGIGMVGKESRAGARRAGASQVVAAEERIGVYGQG